MADTYVLVFQRTRQTPEGPVYDDRWTGYVQWTDPRTGQRRQAAPGFGTQEEAQKFVDAERERLEFSNFWGVPHKVTVARWAGFWLEAMTARANRQRTNEGYEYFLSRYIVPYIGQQKVRELTPMRIESFYSELLNPTTRTKPKRRALAPRTVDGVHRTLSMCLQSAVDEGVIATNPAKRAHHPSVSGSAGEVWDEAQLVRYLVAIGTQRYHAALRIAAMTGLRLGEVVGLRWHDIDFESATLRVARSVTEGRHGMIESSPKTKAGCRSISLDEQTLQILAHARTALGQKVPGMAEWELDLTPIVTRRGSLDGGTPSGLRQAHERAILFANRDKRLQPLPWRRFHDLRHTHASLLLAHRWSISDVSKRLGHASVNVTLSMYAHVITQDKRAEMNEFAELLARTSRTVPGAGDDQ